MGTHGTHYHPDHPHTGTRDAPFISGPSQGSSSDTYGPFLAVTDLRPILFCSMKVVYKAKPLLPISVVSVSSFRGRGIPSMPPLCFPLFWGLAFTSYPDRLKEVHTTLVSIEHPDDFHNYIWMTSISHPNIIVRIID